MLRLREAFQVISYPEKPYRWQSVASEWRELAEALLHLDLSEIKEEWSDACFVTQVALWQRVGWLDAPIFWGTPAFRKWKARQEVWREIFRSHGLEFHQKYLWEGSNFQKPEKVRLALAAARREQR